MRPLRTDVEKACAGGSGTLARQDADEEVSEFVLVVARKPADG
jgi:hypothetical protein